MFKCKAPECFVAAASAILVNSFGSSFEKCQTENIKMDAMRFAAMLARNLRA